MRRPLPVWPLAVAAALSSLLAGFAAASGRPRPGQPASHQAYVRDVKAAQMGALQQALAVYDAALARDPDDVVAAVERCRFLDEALHTDDDDEPADDDGDLRVACRESLARRFPNRPEALLYRLDFTWGDERTAFVKELLAKPKLVWSDHERAHLHEQLANVYVAHKQPELAADEARQALLLDPAVDLSLIRGRQLLAQGRRTEAVVALATHPDGNGFELMQKARLLADAGSPLRALWLIARAQRQSHAFIDPAQHAAILESAGKLDEARAKYAQQPATSNRHATLAHLFELDLVGGDPAAADRSYQALRDLGWRADPFGGYRLALARKHPSRRWRARDLLGLLGFVLGLAWCLVMPALWIVPIHYWSLWRRLQRPLALPPPRLVTRWRFRELWLGSAAMLVAQMSGLFLFHYAEATSWWWRAANEKLTTPPRELANLGLWNMLAEVLLLAALLVRRSDLRLFGPGVWTVGKALGRAVLATGALFLFASAYAMATRHGAAHGVSPGVLSIEEMIVSLRQVYGLGAVILVVVILTPLAEELVFRSLMLDVFARYLPFFAANVLQASLFAAAHGEVRKLPYLFVVGLLAGWLRARSGGLLASITLHALNNAFAMTVALAASAHPVAAPKPAAPESIPPALMSCIARTPNLKTLVPAGNPGSAAAAMSLNNAAWLVAIDPAATPNCLRQAEDALDGALQQFPEMPHMLDTEATLFYRQGRYDEAIDLERATIERFDQGSVNYAQLARFLRARRQFWGPLVLGDGSPKSVKIKLVPDHGGQAYQLDLGDAFPDGVTVYFRVSSGETDLGLLRAQFGPRHERSYRLVPTTGPMPIEPGSVSFELALLDSRGTDGGSPGLWSWMQSFPNPAVANYP